MCCYSSKVVGVVYHPSFRTGAFSSHMVTHSSILTRTSLFALLPVFPWRAKVFTAIKKKDNSVQVFVHLKVAEQNNTTTQKESTCDKNIASNSTALIERLCENFNVLYIRPKGLPLDH